MYFFNQDFVSDLWEFMLMNKHVPMFNDGTGDGGEDEPESVKKYRKLIAQLVEESAAIIAEFDASGENITEEKVEKVESNNDKIEYYNQQVALRLKVHNQNKSLNEPNGRLSDPDDEPVDNPNANPEPVPTPRPRNRNSNTNSNPVRRPARAVDPRLSLIHI